jgi:hypothetical protein
VKTLIQILLCSVVIFSCSEDEELSSVSYIDDALIPFFESFEAEAEERGLVIEIGNHVSSARIEPIEDIGVAGICSFSDFTPNQIRIDKEIWDQSSPSFREYVVFHELGHCVLDREHLDDTLPGGICKSLMNSNTSPCYTQYNAGLRTAFIDELFTNL